MGATCAVEQRDRPLSKALGALHGADKGQFYHQVNAALEGGAGADPFVKQRHISSLCEVAAHHGDDVIGSQLFPDFLYV